MGKSRVRTLALTGLAFAGCSLVVGAGTASAAPVDCDGEVNSLNKKNFEYEFTCEAALEGTADKIDAYSLISNKQVGGFETEVIVLDPAGEPTSQAFGCEGPIPGFGFGCNGGSAGATLGNTPQSAFSLSANPCSEREQRQKWKMWLVVQADKINPATQARTPTSSEPFPLSLPKCKPARKS